MPFAISRRHLMIGAATTVAASGCSSLTTGVNAPRIFSRKPWASPKVTRNAVIGTVVGHRPFRERGFRVDKEMFDKKTVVHNYGHGGGGISLGWGSSGLAVRQIADRAPGEVAVIGSGIMGLCSARLLQDAGWQVTIYTRDRFQHTTSRVAGGQWSPASTHSHGAVSDAFIAQLDAAARISHHAYASLPAAKYGISWMENYHVQAEPRESKPPTYHDVFAYSKTLAPGSHPFGDGSLYAYGDVTMLINPGVLLRQLTSDVLLAGGKILKRQFHSLDDVMTLREPVIFNCSGLGAAKLFGDKELVPVKGQLVFLPPDPAVDYMTVGPNAGLDILYMFPRSDVTLLGGTYKKGDDSRHSEAEETQRIIDGHTALFQQF